MMGRLKELMMDQSPIPISDDEHLEQNEVNAALESIGAGPTLLIQCLTTLLNQTEGSKQILLKVCMQSLVMQLNQAQLKDLEKTCLTFTRDDDLPAKERNHFVNLLDVSQDLLRDLQTLKDSRGKLVDWQLNWNNQCEQLLTSHIDGLPTYISAAIIRKHLTLLDDFPLGKPVRKRVREEPQPSCTTALKKKKTATTTSITPVNTKEVTADADGSTDTDSSDGLVETYCTAETSTKTTSSVGCAITLKKEDVSYTWKSTKFPIWKRYVHFDVFPDMKAMKKTHPMQQWKLAKFRSKIAVGNPLYPDLWRRTKAAIKEMEIVLLENAKVHPQVVTDRVEKYGAN